MFTSKTNNIYLWDAFAPTSIITNHDLLGNYSLKEIDTIYKNNKLGDISYLYKDLLKVQITIYDQSDNVNSFIYKGDKYWLDKQQRSCLKTVVESGLNQIEFVIGQNVVILPSEFIKQFILDLEAYAYKCYVITAKHLQKIQTLQNIEDIINYDYTIGYPEKLVLE